MSLVKNVCDFLQANGHQTSYEEVKAVIGALSNSDYQELTYAMADKNPELIVYIMSAYQAKR